MAVVPTTTLYYTTTHTRSPGTPSGSWRGGWRGGWLSTSIKCDKSTNRQQTDGQTGTSRLRDHHLCAHRYEPSPNPCLAMFLLRLFFAASIHASGNRGRCSECIRHPPTAGPFARPLRQAASLQGHARGWCILVGRSNGWPASSVRPPRGRCLRGCARGSSAPYCILSEARIHLHEHSQSASSPGRGAPSAARAAVASGALRRSSECATGAAWHGTAPR